MYIKRIKCLSCGGKFPDIDGPVHRYMTSSPGCWSAYGEVLTREYSDPSYFEVHRLTVDAYAAQHPGSKDRQSIQSVGFHLLRLYLFLELRLAPERINDVTLAAVKLKHSFFWLKPPSSVGSITIADIASAKDVGEHRAAVLAWAQDVWDAWSLHHETIKSWVPADAL